ncbi:MAG TPA: sugar porter family MFS transporter [bacterium]|nr:sugar porter family MFS transporter [bacterium]HPN43782.1 sugar porter family MFS transporter [bacterium]
MKGKSFVISCTLVAALGGFLFGFDTAVISGTTAALKQVYSLNDFWLGFTVAIALIGTVIGSIAVGKPGDLYGRKRVLIILAVFYTVSAVGSALAWDWYSFLFFRFLGGLGVGGSSVMAPMYIAEISPARMRGRLVAVSQFNIVSGILVSFFSNYLIAGSIQNDAWRWMLGVETIPAVLFFALLFFIPFSPRWLVKQNRIEEARAILTRIGEPNVQQELDEIVESLKAESAGKKEQLFTAKYKKPVLFAVLIACFNQLSGINAIMYYAPEIFKMTGLAADTALLQTVAIGVTNMIFTILAMTVIDKFGRKTLLLVGSVGMVVFMGLVALAFYTQNFGGYAVMFYLVGFIAFFAFSQGAVIWVFLAEIFPNKVRAKGQALGSFTHWVGAAAISWLFPVAANIPLIGGGNAFMFFSVMMILHFIFVWKWLPETKGRSLEQIQKDLGIS